MKARLRTIALCLSALAVATVLPNFGNPVPRENVETNVVGEAFFVRWDGVPDRTYFVRTSSDLKEWTFLPEIEHGDEFFQYGFESSNPTLFVDVLYTDGSALVDGELNPEEADFDGDGLPSLYELLNGLNPLNAHTIEGIPDGHTDLELDGRIDRFESTADPKSHPSRIDNPKVRLSVQVLPIIATN